MAKKLVLTEYEEFETWAVELKAEDGHNVYMEAEDENGIPAEDNAYLTQKMFGGHVVRATCYYTPWERAVPEPDEDA
jgi:hypothetical protein